MYADVPVIPDRSPYDWNGWGMHYSPREDPAEERAVTPEEWQAGVEKIVETALAETFASR
jgi:hypothetical protein